MGLDNLSRTGTGYSVSSRPGSFTRSLSSATMRGSLKNLKDNKAAINKVMGSSNVKTAIRRGGLSRQQQLSAYNKMLKEDKHMTLEDKRDLKKLLKGFSK